MLISAALLFQFRSRQQEKDPCSKKPFSVYFFSQVFRALGNLQEEREEVGTIIPAEAGIRSIHCLLDCRYRGVTVDWGFPHPFRQSAKEE